MDRKEFIGLLGVTAATTALASCIVGCKKGDFSTVASAPSNIDFTLDLNQPANSALNTSGNYLYSNGLIIAKTLSGSFIAVSKACTHQSYPVKFDSQYDVFYCPSHGATFSESGLVLGGPARQALKQYNVSLAGSLLRIYS